MATWRIYSGATGLGDGTSWINAYTSIIDAVAAKAATGPHTYLVADNHVEGASWSGGTIMDFGTLGWSTLTSVETTGDTYSKGAKLDNSTTWTLSFQGFCDISGVLFENQRGIAFFDGSDLLHIIIRDGKLATLRNSVSDTITFGIVSNNGYNRMEIYDTEIVFGNASQGFVMSHSAKALVSGCTLSGVTLTAVIKSSSDGVNIDFENTDFNGCTNLGWFGADLDAQCQNITYNRCIAGASATVDTSVGINGNANIDIYSLKRGTDDSFHYFESVYKDCGKALESTAVFRDNGATYDSINGFSAEYIPSANVIEYTKPLRYELGTYEVDLTAGATLTFHIIINDSSQLGVPTALTDSECWIEATHPDATDNAFGKTVTTIPANIFTTPTTLTASTETWTGEEATHKRKHQISVTLPTVAMVDAPVAVSLCLAKNITTENGNEMFVCPLPIVT